MPRKILAAFAGLLFAAMFAPQSRATTFTTSTFTVDTFAFFGDGSSTTDLGSLFATEGTTQCPGGGDCFTLQLAFKITNTTANPAFYTSSRAPPTFVAGDPSNNFTESAFDPFLCMLPVGAGKSCVVFFNYSTTDLTGISDFDGDFAVNSAKLTITSHNPVPPSNVTLSIPFQMTDFDPVTPLPAALPLFATGIGALGLLGWRRKRKAQANG
jgi:hypothetical protein